MAIATRPPVARTPTPGELLAREVPPGRVLLHATPGTATVADVESVRRREGRRCGLIDGPLAGKAAGHAEASPAARPIDLRMGRAEPRRRGVVLGADGMIRPVADRVRIPDMAVEVRGPSKTRREMDRNLREDFDAPGGRRAPVSGGDGRRRAPTPGSRHPPRPTGRSTRRRGPRACRTGRPWPH